jgi:hypothetical protein
MDHKRVINRLVGHKRVINGLTGYSLNPNPLYSCRVRVGYAGRFKIAKPSTNHTRFSTSAYMYFFCSFPLKVKRGG